MIDRTIGQYLKDMAAKQPDNEALVCVDKLRLTYRKFDEVTDRAAKGLLSIGIKKGDKVAIWATNVPEWIITIFATAKIGAILVTVNTAYKRYELEYVLKQSDTKALIMINGFKDSDYIQEVNDIIPDLKSQRKGRIKCKTLPYLKSIIYVGEDKHEGMYNFDELYSRGDMLSDDELAKASRLLDKDDVINIQYTSGTTGFPKGVMLSHYNLLNNGDGIASRMKFTPKDRLCITVPLFHCFGYVLSVMVCLTKGSTMVLVDHFNPLVVMNTIEREKCTAVHGVPTMFITMLGHPDFVKYDFSSLRTGIMAGSVCPTKIMKAVVDKMNIKGITSVYGLTEASPGITQTSVDDSLEDRVSTVGTVLPNIEMKIIDPKTGKEVPRGVKGEIMTKGYNVMKGYYKMKKETNEVIEGGWLHSGDLGYLDGKGYLRITGRLKEMIVRGGENIYPREIEEYLYRYPGIEDVQIVGVPDQKYGEEVMAYVIPKEGAALTEESIINYARKGLARFEVPKYVKFLDKFPMTASNKIQKYKLKEMAIKDLDLNCGF